MSKEPAAHFWCGDCCEKVTATHYTKLKEANDAHMLVCRRRKENTDELLRAAAPAPQAQASDA
jgi:hypothetical protein